MEQQILTNEKINEIVGLAQQKYYDGIINMDVDQALMIMLKITHYFKFEMDDQKQWYLKYNDRINRELEQFRADQGINNFQDEMEWTKKNGALQYHIGIPDLLLHTLYSLNGTHFRDRDRDYDWEDKFDKIFIGMPYGREFDEAIINFLLLPLYNRTHGTKYTIPGHLPMSEG
jgi:hypothetical protein